MDFVANEEAAYAFHISLYGGRTRRTASSGFWIRTRSLHGPINFGPARHNFGPARPEPNEWFCFGGPAHRNKARPGWLEVPGFGKGSEDLTPEWCQGEAVGCESPSRILGLRIMCSVQWYTTHSCTHTMSCLRMITRPMAMSVIHPNHHQQQQQQSPCRQGVTALTDFR